MQRKDDVMMMSPVKGYSIKGNLLSPPCSPKPSPMKASSKMLPPTPISSTMTSAKWLRTVIAPLSAEPSSELLHFFQACDTDITRQVKLRAQILLEAIFSSERRVNWGICGGVAGLSSMDSTWAEQRRLEALKLYYRVVGSMCHAESQRLKCENLSALLINERFHRCMLACSAELVLATYKTVSLNFPAVLEPTGITAFDVWKVIESFVRHEETLPRELKRHLNSIEEKILEKLAWEKGSSLYNSLIIAKPALQEYINRLRLLAEPMPSLESLNARYQIIDGSTRAELLQGSH
jgi:retinoblastoma-like protein 1